jgi:pre-mRNA-splicing factor CWC26
VEAAQETVYRDASGRKIDMKLARAEAAQKKREKEEKDAQKMEWGKGLVQREEKEKRKTQLEKNKSLPFSRHADDMELNEELMARDMWNDPAAAFLTVSATVRDAITGFLILPFRRKNQRLRKSRSIAVLHPLPIALA